MNMKLEVVIVPVSDVDRAKAFYGKVGFRLDIDIVNENFRGIQFTPPRSEASIIFGKGVTSARSASADLVLAVDDVDAVRTDLIPRHQRQRSVPLRRRSLQQLCGEPARRGARPGGSFLLLVCLVRRPRRQPLAYSRRSQHGCLAANGNRREHKPSTSQLSRISSTRRRSTTVSTRRPTPRTTGGTGTRPT
jgi:catechol 2,3-dioxygenase-like lactoylglutathione lyase family enzyme